MGGFIYLLALTIVFLVGCATTPYVSFRIPCANCDNDLTKWKQDCLPTCLNISQNPSDYNATIPQGWELAGAEKQKFTLVHVVGGSGTDTPISCVCAFQKLTTEQHQQAKILFGK